MKTRWGDYATTPNLLGLSFTIQLALLLYANHVDSHPERYGGLKYTDVDWRVVSDGAKLIFGLSPEGMARGRGKRAEGWFIHDTGLPVGDPYDRETFRYTPLLPLLLSSSVVHPLLGKLVLVLLSLIVTPVLLATGAPERATHAIWTLNPFVMNITTRGSPEAIIALLLGMLLLCLRNADRAPYPDLKAVWETFAAITLAVAVSWKIFPVIYVPAIWASLAGRWGWFGGEVWWFGAVTATTFVTLNWSLWSIWGQPFLDHTFLYHLTRQDHRHNFSAYFYPIYHSFFPSSASSSASSSALGLGRIVAANPAILQVLQHPLLSFLPQITLVAYVGFTLPLRIGIEATLFFQTALFVVFNKVVTSQYFIWFLPFLPHLITRLPPFRAALLVTAWIGAQAIWLGYGYKLEFLGESVHLQVWIAGLGLFGVSCWVLGELLERVSVSAASKSEHKHRAGAEVEGRNANASHGKGAGAGTEQAGKGVKPQALGRR